MGIEEEVFDWAAAEHVLEVAELSDRIVQGVMTSEGRPVKKGDEIKFHSEYGIICATASQIAQLGKDGHIKEPAKVCDTVRDQKTFNAYIARHGRKDGYHVLDTTHNVCFLFPKLGNTFEQNEGFNFYTHIPIAFLMKGAPEESSIDPQQLYGALFYGKTKPEYHELMRGLFQSEKTSEFNGIGTRSRLAIEITKAYPGLKAVVMRGTAYEPVMVGAGFETTEQGITRTVIMDYDKKNDTVFGKITHYCKEDAHKIIPFPGKEHYRMRSERAA